jgi:hypothetical protein
MGSSVCKWCSVSSTSMLTPSKFLVASPLSVWPCCPFFFAKEHHTRKQTTFGRSFRKWTRSISQSKIKNFTRRSNRQSKWEYSCFKTSLMKTLASSLKNFRHCCTSKAVAKLKIYLIISASPYLDLNALFRRRNSLLDSPASNVLGSLIEFACVPSC